MTVYTGSVRRIKQGQLVDLPQFLVETELVKNDNALASEMGSTNVRVGSTIFGARNYAK